MKNQLSDRIFSTLLEGSFGVIIVQIIALLIFVFPLQSQTSPYQLKPKKELTIIGSGLALGGTAYYFHDKLQPLSIPEINDHLDTGISSFEEWSTQQGSKTSDRASDVLLYSSQLIPVIMTFADKDMRTDYLKIGTLYSETFLVNLGLTALMKNTVRRTRPYVYDPDVPIDEKLTKSARTSFYSGHTSETASMCFLTARLYADYHPDSKWKPFVWTAAATVPAVTGYLRMRAGKHFPSDVLVGYLTGAAVGYFMPRLHQRKGEGKKRVLD